MTSSQPRHAAPGPSRKITVTSGTALIAGLVVAVVALVGGWARRWMSDDGLIVLRTVRNLLAGNGPVFNAGERVEANTSVLWQYLIYAVAKLTDARLETIATWLALLATVAAVALATAGTTRLYRPRRGLLLLPLGTLLYLALPPARDFATSGLEWGLSLCYLAALWWALTRWATTERPQARLVDAPTAVAAFLTGLSWLVRPELVLYGAAAGLVLLLADRNWRRIGAILAIAVPAPAAYEVFRMGYYGLLVPHTAVAKSATGAAWREGLGYVANFSGPYFLPLAVLVAAVGAVATLRLIGWRRELNRRTAIVAVMLACAGLHALYVVRVGGDFMHGRMLLLPLFAALLPVSVIPVWDVAGGRPGRPQATWGFVAAGAWLVGMGWAVSAVSGGSGWTMPADGTQLSIVDERTFWTLATEREEGDPPQVAEDFLPAAGLTGFPEALAAAQDNDDALILQTVADDGSFGWVTVPRAAGDVGGGLEATPPTLYLVNLGMTSMNAPLDVRVLDTVGLATPLAARQPRQIDGRIGHDKWLPPVWYFADSAAGYTELPDYLSPDVVARARTALFTPDYVELFASYRAPLDAGRFIANLKFALTGGRTIAFESDPALIDVSAADPGARIAWG